MMILILILIKLILNFVLVEKIICKPPNQFVHVFAPPGTGKTTLAAKIVRDCLREGKEVFSNVPIRGAKIFDLKDLGHKDFRDCVLIIDEAGTKLGNRDWQKNHDSDQVNFIKKHRHYNVDIYLFSQSYGDIDNKFRELTTKLLMLKKSRIPFFVHAIAIRKTMDLINGQILEFFEWSKSESFRFFTPVTWAYFNSYDQKESLEEMYNEIYTMLDL